MLQRPKFGLGDDEVQAALAALVQTAEVVDVTSDLRVVEADPDDDAVLCAAHDGRADVIVSGDRHLLDLKEWQGIRIMRAGELLDEMDAA